MSILKQFSSSERLKQAQLEVQVRVKSLKFNRRNNQNLVLFLTLIRPRDNKAPIRLSTISKTIEPRMPSNRNNGSDRSNRVRTRREEHTFQFDLTRLTPRRHPTNSKRYPKLSKWKLPSYFNIMISCDFAGRNARCSRFNARIVGSPQIIVQTIKKKKRVNA